MSQIGHIIKMERIKKNLKQSYLARGICSPSYLSKIENNTVHASREIIDLLIKKLNLNAETIKYNKKIDIYHEINNIYKQAILYKDKNYIKCKIKDLEGNLYSVQENIFYTLTLVVLRLFLMENNLEKGKDYIDFLRHYKNKMSKKQLFVFEINKGIYFYKKKEIRKAVEIFSDAAKHVELIPIEEWELADFYYILAVVFMADRQTLKSYDYANRANDYFLKNFIYVRVVECYTLIAIAYSRSGRYLESLETYKLILKIIDKISETEILRGKIYHNIGCLYSLQNQSKNAIKYFMKSLEHKDKDNDKLITILSLIEEHMKNNNRYLVGKWLKVGWEILNRDKNVNTDYYYHFLIYEELYIKGYLSKKTAFKGIKYFTRQGDLHNSHKYKIMLADSLYKQGMYKLAAEIYKLALESNTHLKC